MKVAFVGAHSTGKSTLFDEIIKHPKFDSYKKIDTIARNRPKGFTDKANQGYVNRAYLWQHFINPNFISARSMYDAWAYSRVNCGLTFYKQRFNLGVQLIHYDYLFYLPIEFQLKDDNYRPTTIEYQYKIDTELNKLFKEYNVNYTTITGTIEQRLSRIKYFLEL